jgi:hypothetical protein
MSGYMIFHDSTEEQFGDTKGIIIVRKSKKNRQQKAKGQTTIYKAYT